MANGNVRRRLMAEHFRSEGNKMPLSEDQKNYIVEKAVEILRAPDKKERIEALKKEVMSLEESTDEFNLDDAVYSVLVALEELYNTQ